MQAQATLAPSWIGNTNAQFGAETLLAVLNPATEEVLASIPVEGEAGVRAAVTAAAEAFPAWAALAPNRRRQYLHEAAAKVRANEASIAHLLTLENGKPLAQARAEVRGAAALLEEYGELAVHFRSGVQAANAGELVMQRWEPRGVSACIVPWNFPLQLCMETVAPNLAVGNTVVLKPSEKTPLATRLIVTTCFDAFPPGVCNLLLGDGPTTGDALIRHPLIETVMFIGSVGTGRRIGQTIGATTKRAILELGGKDPLIIDETVDVDQAVKFAADACFANAGQICTSTERVYVHRTIFGRFVERLAQLSRDYRVGNGLEDGVQMGPLIDDVQLTKVEMHVAQAVERGATLVSGGKRISGPGFFYLPTVMTDVNHDMLLMREETFGPIAPVMAFDDFDEAIALANDSDYGLAGIVLTTSATRVMQATQQLKVGMLKVNAPRGKAPGASSEPFKCSGLGAGYGVEVLQALTRQKSVQWRQQLV
ncbi:MAG: aldehyde dehydrogenase [bacterium]|nr:aldehyde dehydrogenase [bacterium]